MIRARRVARGGAGACLALALAGAAWAFPAARAHADGTAVRPAPPVGQALVVLLGDTSVHRRPGLGSARLGTLVDRRPLTGVPTTLPVLARRTNPDGTRWVDVRLPGRPNSHSGWITASHTMPSWTPWQLIVNLDERTVIVENRGRVIRRFPAVVGKPSTPTPTGRFFVEEAVALSPYAAGAPYALATSDRSDTLEHFDGGPGQIAIHGTSGLAGLPGTAVSHGCVRISTADISWLAARIGPGVPVVILR